MHSKHCVVYFFSVTIVIFQNHVSGISHVTPLSKNYMLQLIPQNQSISLTQFL